MKLHIFSLGLYHLSYPGSIESTDLNLSLESNAMQGVVVCGTHHLTGELTLSLIIYSIGSVHTALDISYATCRSDIA